MAAPHPRLIIEIKHGMVTAIHADGIDLSHVTAIILDSDTDTADDDDLTPYGDSMVYFTPTDIFPADDEMSRDVRRAYDTWALT